MKSRMIGILLNNDMYQGIPRQRTKHEALRFYEEAGKQYALTPCYFRLKDISFRRRSVMAYVRSRRGYVRKSVPLPLVIHNRTIYRDERHKATIRRLIALGHVVFNAWNRYPKSEIHRILMLKPELRPHLPGTEHLSEASLSAFMNRYDALILKPDNGSIGKGIHLLERHETGGWIWKTADGYVHEFTDASALRSELLVRLQSRPYLVQQRLPLAEFQGSPIDFRISVQKNGDGRFAVTGIAVKVAAAKKFVTNVAQGGTVYTYEDMMSRFPHLPYRECKQQLMRFALDVAGHLSCHLPHVADLGLDLGMTAFGFPVFVECNCRDLRYSFREGGMPAEWKATYANPIAYGKYLLDNHSPHRYSIL